MKTALTVGAIEGTPWWFSASVLFWYSCSVVNSQKTVRTPHAVSISE